MSLTVRYQSQPKAPRRAGEGNVAKVMILLLDSCEYLSVCSIKYTFLPFFPPQNLQLLISSFSLVVLV